MPPVGPWNLCSFRSVCTLFASLAFGLPTALAAESQPQPSLAVWSVDAQKLPAKLRRKGPAAVVEAAQGNADWQVVGTRTVDKAARKLKRCKPKASPACARKIGEATKASHVLVVLFSGKRKRPQAVVGLVAVSSGKELASTRARVAAKSWKQEAARLVTEVLAAAAPPAPEVATAPEPEPESEPELAALPPTPKAPEPPPASEPVAPAPVVEQEPAAKAEAGTPTEVIEAASVADSGAARSEEEAVSEVAAPQEAEDDKPTFAIGLHVDLMFPAGKTGKATFGDALEPKPGRTVTGAVLLGLRYYLPEPVRDVGLALEVGWYQLALSGARENASDPDFTSFSYQSTLHMLPVFVGPVYRLPRLLGALPLDLHVEAGLVYQYVWASTTYESQGVKVANSTQSDSGLGYYGGAEVSLTLGPGSVHFGVRYSSARTDLQLASIYDGAYNDTPGDTGGTSLLLGYRLEL